MLCNNEYRVFTSSRHLLLTTIWSLAVWSSLGAMNHDQLMNDGCKIHKHSPNPKVIVVEKSHSYMCVSEKLGEMTLLDAGDKTGCVQVCRGRG